MVIGKIKPAATMVAQFAAGVEVEAIQHEGRIFMPVLGMGEFAAEEPAGGAAPSRKPEPTPAAAAPAAKTETTGKTYTEDELMDMETKDLLKLCKSMGIDPDATEGKNTNKKLRLLILDAQESGAGDEQPADAAPEEGAEDDLAKQIAEVLEDFDNGKKNKKKTIAAIADLVEGADTDDVSDLIEEFEEDGDADIDEFAEKIANKLTGKKPAKKESKTPAKKEAKEELVDAADLEVGDKVSVFWADENNDWFDGEVTAISKKGKVTVTYEDETEEVIDPEIHTKIKLLSKGE